MQGQGVDRRDSLVPLPGAQLASLLPGHYVFVSIDHIVDAVKEGSGVSIYIFPTPNNVLVD